MNLPSGENCGWLSPLLAERDLARRRAAVGRHFPDVRARLHLVLLGHPLPHAVNHPASIGRNRRALDRLDVQDIVKRRGPLRLSGSGGRHEREDDKEFAHRGPAQYTGIFLDGSAASAGLFGNRTHSSAPLSLSAGGSDHGIRAGQADCGREKRVVERAAPVAAREWPAVVAANHPDGGCGSGWRDSHSCKAREQGSADLLPRHGARPLPRPGASGRRRDHRSHRQAPAQPHGRARRTGDGQRQGRHQRHHDVRTGSWRPE